MKSKFLRELNFKTLLDYPDEFRPQREYKPPLACDRFCIECEKSGVVATGQLTLMSHGCDTDDFEKILGSSMNNGDAVKIPIMFLLEDPGGNYGNGEDRTHRDQKITKSPPVKRYYWSPSVTTWPTAMDEVIEDGNLYGSYFAYLMQVSVNSSTRDGYGSFTFQGSSSSRVASSREARLGRISNR